MAGTERTIDLPQETSNNLKFGAFKGVFSPSILTILGVIMYLRFGWVVGQGGLVGAIMVVLLAHVISLTTGLSICSIATNRTVKTGGDYYMISRSLGIPIGGAIGLALFFALAFSTSLYIIGFAESFLGAFGLENTLMNRRLVGTIACVLITAVTFISTSLALKLQYLVLATIALSLISLFLGKSPSPPTGNIQLWFSSGGESFETVFAVFFPAVTGFTAGVAMSGDLKDPKRAIPLGTMAAILVGLVMYLAIPIFFAFTLDSHTLKTDGLVWLRIARVPQLVIAGVFAATLSSALGSILGAPRYLQALAMDGVVPRIFGKGFGKLNEPRIGTLATFAFAQAGIMLGELNLIARVITMFFLTSYGFLCLACAVQSWSGISSFRPQFKTPAWVSFAGALTSLAVMFKLDMLAMLGGTMLMLAVYWMLKRRQFTTSPGDTWGGFWSAVVQMGVQRLHKRRMDLKNWRPNALVFGGAPAQRQHLIDLSKWLFQTRGIATYFYLIEGSIQEQLKRAQSLEQTVRQVVAKGYTEMLSRVSVCPNIYDGITNAAQSYGLSGMIPNTILMGWATASEKPAHFASLVSDLLILDYNLLLLRLDPERVFATNSSIDIWWGGMERNGSLMLLLSHFILSTDEWAKAQVRINVIVNDEGDAAQTRENLLKVISSSRVKAVPNVIVKESAAEPNGSIILRESQQADLVILGLRPPEDENQELFVQRVNGMLNGLGTVLLVRASSGFNESNLLTEDG